MSTLETFWIPPKDLLFSTCLKGFFEIIQDIPISAKYGFHIRSTRDVSPPGQGFSYGLWPSILLTLPNWPCCLCPGHGQGRGLDTLLPALYLGNGGWIASSSFLLLSPWVFFWKSLSFALWYSGSPCPLFWESHNFSLTFLSIRFRPK